MARSPVAERSSAIRGWQYRVDCGLGSTLEEIDWLWTRSRTPSRYQSEIYREHNTNHSAIGAPIQFAFSRASTRRLAHKDCRVAAGRIFSAGEPRRVRGPIPHGVPGQGGTFIQLLEI